MHRRALCLALLAPVLGTTSIGARHAAAADAALTFPRDFGAHPGTRTEWWYITGTLEAAPRTWGFQITFFRSETGVAADNPSRFAARELVFAHAALTDIAGRRLRHDERIARS